VVFSDRAGDEPTPSLSFGFDVIVTIGIAAD
jgi:hypothetical protein